MDPGDLFDHLHQSLCHLQCPALPMAANTAFTPYTAGQRHETAGHVSSISAWSRGDQRE